MLERKKTEMELKMFLKEKPIDVATINVFKLNLPGYINSLKEKLKDDREELLDLTEQKPQFFIDQVPLTLNGSCYLKN